MEGESITHIDPNGKIMNCKSGHAAPIVTPGAVVDTSHRSDADAALGDRAPTVSGDQEQDLQDWLETFTDGLGDHPAFVVKNFPKTPLPPIPVRPSNKSGGETQFIHSFSEGVQL